MYSLASVSRPRLSEADPKFFVFETSCYSFGGRIRHFAKVNMNKVNMLYCIVSTEHGGGGGWIAINHLDTFTIRLIIMSMCKLVRRSHYCATLAQVMSQYRMTIS